MRGGARPVAAHDRWSKILHVVDIYFFIILSAYNILDEGWRDLSVGGSSMDARLGVNDALSG